MDYLIRCQIFLELLQLLVLRMLSHLPSIPSELTYFLLECTSKLIFLHMESQDLHLLLSIYLYPLPLSELNSNG